MTESGLPGARDTYIHWAQEMFDQAGMLREIVKWDYELRNGEQLETVVDRALDIATTAPGGPVYLSLPREVLAAAAARLLLRRAVAPRSPPPPPGPTRARSSEAARHPRRGGATR